KASLVAITAMILVGAAGVFASKHLIATAAQSAPPVASAPAAPPISPMSRVLWGGPAKGLWLGRMELDGVSAELVEEEVSTGKADPPPPVFTVKTAQPPAMEWRDGLELHLDLELESARTITVFMVLMDEQGDWAA